MKITVIIPAYNAEKHIARAIESVLAQTRPVDEIIVVDDGSTDATGEVVRSYGPKVILIQQPNAGVSVARNTGIEHAAGDWIAFLDADDEWLPEKLSIQADHLAQHPELEWTTANYFRCDCRQHHKQLTDMSLLKIEKCRSLEESEGVFSDYFAACAAGGKGHTDTMLIRRDLLIRAGMFLPGQKRMNDIDMWFRIAYIRPQIGFVYDPLAVYHLGVENSIIKIHTDWQLVDVFLQRHFELAQKAGRADAFRPCAAIGLSYWMRLLMAKGAGDGIRRLISSYGDLLAPSFRTSCYVGSFCPALWLAKEKIKKTVRSHLKRN